jgi:ubiquinone biosynthesis protein UbiJ
VRIEGDAEVAQKFRELLEQAQPDFEEELSRVIGDVAARQVANFARGFLDWGRKAGGSLATNVAEYLQEEGRDLPTRTEVEEFLSSVDQLRDDAERLEARLARIEARGRTAAR